MGALSLPSSGGVVIDSSTLIYGVERHPTYAALIAPLWHAARARTIDLVASELTILETLVSPIRTGNTSLQDDYETALFRSDLGLLPITTDVLLLAAEIRAVHNLRTPDAIHAATALDARVAAFVTNDVHFRRVPGLNVCVLDDLLS